MILLTFNLYALDYSKPLMLKKKFERFKRASVLNCQDSYTQGEVKEYREAFISKIDCEYKCQGQKAQSHMIEEIFRPNELSLSPGDGSSSTATMWRSLGITINTFKKEQCFNFAKNECENIESFKVKSISSGNWILDKDINCSTKEVIYSPFDTKYKLQLPKNRRLSYADNTPFSFLDNSVDESTNKMSEFFKNQKEAQLIIDKKDCKKSIKVNTCFGDCVWEEKSAKNGYVETISTPNPLGEDSFSICVDNYTSKIKASSKSVVNFKCEKFIWEFLRTSGMTGESCAALRFNHNCANLKL